VLGESRSRFDSGQFRRLLGAHGRLPSVRAGVVNSIANPHVVLLRYQCLQVYTP
jgi:hypothetical protein